MKNTMFPPDLAIQQIDKMVIPASVYDLVINRKKLLLKKYLEQHPKLMFNIAHFNQDLKVTNQYSCDQKCQCPYQVPWVTQFGKESGKGNNVYLSFIQQVDLYRYMIRYWYPSPKTSNMRFLSMVALGTLQELKVAKTYIGAGLDACVTGNRDVIVGKNFANNYQFIQYLDKNQIWL
jgi:hypothetical protein